MSLLEPTAPPPTAEEAQGFIEQALLAAAKRAQRPREDVDLDLMSVARTYLGARDQRGFNDDQIGRYLGPFRDVAWDLCRSGMLRPGWHGYGKPTNFCPEFCFSLTAAGRERLLATASEGRVFTVAAGLVGELERIGQRFGEAFNERVRDAVASFLGGAPLACCAMCGAAAEAILLSLAIEIDGNETKVLRAYQRHDGRSQIVKSVVGSLRPDQRDKLNTYFDLIKHFRDLSGHGAPAGLNLATAHDKLGLLRAMVILVAPHWDEIVATAKKGRAGSQLSPSR